MAHGALVQGYVERTQAHSEEAAMTNQADEHAGEYDANEDQDAEPASKPTGARSEETVPEEADPDAGPSTEPDD